MPQPGGCGEKRRAPAHRHGTPGYEAFRRDVEADKAKRYASYSEGDFYSMNIARRESAKKAIRKRDGR